MSETPGPIPPNISKPRPPEQAIVPPVVAAPHTGSLFRGVFLGFAANIAGCVACAIVGATLGGALSAFGTAFAWVMIPLFAIPFGVGLGQWLWLVPMRRSYLRHGETETAKGLVVAGAITFLLNAGCWGLIMGGSFRFAG